MRAMRTVAFATILALLLQCGPSAAARRTTTWKDAIIPTCAYTVAFDDANYQETAVRNSMDVLFGFFFFPFADGPTKPEDIAKLDLDRYQAQCTDALARAERLSLVSLPGFKNYWAGKVEQIRD